MNNSLFVFFLPDNWNMAFGANNSISLVRSIQHYYKIFLYPDPATKYLLFGCDTEQALGFVGFLAQYASYCGKFYVLKILLNKEFKLHMAKLLLK
jgi:hypothetical protein